MTLHGSKSPKNRFNEFIHTSKRRVKRLTRNLTTIFTVSVLLLFFLYIPFIHGRLNAGVEHTGYESPVAVVTDTELYNNSGQNHLKASEPYVTASIHHDAGTDRGKEQATGQRPDTSITASTEHAQDFENSPPLYEPNGGALSPRGDSAWSRAPTPLNTPADITRGYAGSKMLAITLDGGYSANEAAVILDELKKRGIKTTIFLTGTFMSLHPDITRRIVEDGHEVGNHTATHPHLTDYATTYRHNTLDTVKRSALKNELLRAEKIFTTITGASMAPLWRAPYGEVNKEIRAWAFELGYLHIGWTYERETRESLDTLDWVAEPTSHLYRTKEDILKRVVGFGEKTGGAGGGIILMHLGTQRKDDRASAVLGSMLDQLRDKGYRFVTVSTMLGDNSALKTAFRKKSLRLYQKLTRVR